MNGRRTAAVVVALGWGLVAGAAGCGKAKQDAGAPLPAQTTGAETQPAAPSAPPPPAPAEPPAPKAEAPTPTPAPRDADAAPVAADLRALLAEGVDIGPDGQPVVRPGAVEALIDPDMGLYVDVEVRKDPRTPELERVTRWLSRPEVVEARPQELGHLAGADKLAILLRAQADPAIDVLCDEATLICDLGAHPTCARYYFARRTAPPRWAWVGVLEIDCPPDPDVFRERVTRFEALLRIKAPDRVPAP